MTAKDDDDKNVNPEHFSVPFPAAPHLITGQG
jgi:hypothetical protein